MKKIYVGDVMVPLSDYATVPYDATLIDAIRVLESSSNKSADGTYRHRAVLVIDPHGDVIGKLSQVDIMRGFEPNYQQIGTDVDVSRFGFSAAFMHSIQEQFKLWDRPLEELRRIVSRVKVTDVMYKATDLQRVREEDPLDMAMHQIVMGRHQSLLVTRGKKIVGILKSTDAFGALCREIDECT